MKLTPKQKAEKRRKEREEKVKQRKIDRNRRVNMKPEVRKMTNEIEDFLMN